MAKQLVVDANVIAKLYLQDEQYTDKANLLFSRFQEGSIRLLAPRLIIYEVPAAIKSSTFRMKTDDAISSCKQAIASFESLGLYIVDDTNAKNEAVRLAISYACTYYDALYLLLAEDLGCPFITADDKLWKQMRTKVDYVTQLASYQ